MPPIRRYLRITEYSVLECRIYLNNPSDAHRWLLNPRAPILPRVIEAVRPLVLPKLREENARAKSGKGGKKKGWKDIVVEDEFEVSVFLTETSTRHSILRREKVAKGGKGRLGSRDGRLTGTRDVPVEVGEGGPGLLREESDEMLEVRLADLPAAGEEATDGVVMLPKEESREELFVSDGSDAVESQRETRSTGKRKGAAADDADGDDDKKKLGINTTYDGFSIYGRILCLVVKRRGSAKGKEVAGGTGQAMMEDWIASTQMAEGQMVDE